MVPMSLLYGNTVVMETVNGDFTGKFVNSVIGEISETLEMDKNEIHAYTEEVMDRFKNPFIKHALADIALNSISKFKVRVLPSLLQFYKANKILPTHLTFSLACLIQFYKGTWKNEALPVKDSPEIVESFKAAWALATPELMVTNVLSNVEFWGQDLTEIQGLSEAIILALFEIETYGIEVGFAKFNQCY
jgi:tagaturonate reductase